MAIKINGQDLKKRYINWQEIVRIYKNGGEIRPNTVPPTPALWYLSFSPATSAWCTVALEKSEDDPYAVYLEISYDWSTWNDYTIGNTISLSSGERVYMRNKSTEVTWFSLSLYQYYYFNISWATNCSWDINYLLCKNSTTTVSNYCFYRLFLGCTSLVTAPQLSATNLGERCYHYMFHGCTSLVTAPQLPATTLASECYAWMFDWCSSLTTAPSLSATTLASECYKCMFRWCSSLTTAPSLPASNLTSFCYFWMFDWCSSLRATPSLQSTSLATWCYNGMFNWCSSLTTITSLPATNIPWWAYMDMFKNCTSLTTLPALPWHHFYGDGSYNSYYNRMFSWCTNIKISETQTWEYQTPYRIPPSWGMTGNYLGNITWWMFDNTWGTFVWTPNREQTYYTSNTVI